MMDGCSRSEQLRVAVLRFQYRDFAIPIERKTPRLRAAAPGLAAAARRLPSTRHMAEL
jgi:hypothetical protein